MLKTKKLKKKKKKRNKDYLNNKLKRLETKARLAQLVERKALNLVVVGSSPTVGVFN